MNDLRTAVKDLFGGNIAILFLLVFMVTTTSQAQNGLEEYQKEYAENIQKSRIDGVYIPKDLDDAFKELELLSSKESIEKFKNASEDIVAHKLHFGLGRWIDYNWNFEKGSRFEYYLKGLGLKERDHMMQFTIVSWHRHLNNKPLEIEEQVKMYDDIIEKKRLKRKEYEESNKIIVPID